jgi:hypothetical protein
MMPQRKGEPIRTYYTVVVVCCRRSLRVSSGMCDRSCARVNVLLLPSWSVVSALLLPTTDTSIHRQREGMNTTMKFTISRVGEARTGPYQLDGCGCWCVEGDA